MSTTPVAPSSITVLARGQSFRLSRSQIESDAPNYFTSALDGGFQEQQTREFHLDCHPKLFTLVVNHLSGYEVTPIAEKACPPEMTVKQATQALLHDARFLGLSRLEALLSTERRNVETNVETWPKFSVEDITAAAAARGMIPRVSLDDKVLRMKAFGLSFDASSIEYRSETKVELLLPLSDHGHAVLEALGGVQSTGAASVELGGKQARSLRTAFSIDTPEGVLEDDDLDNFLLAFDKDLSPKTRLARARCAPNRRCDVFARAACVVFRSTVQDGGAIVWGVHHVLSFEGKPLANLPHFLLH